MMLIYSWIHPFSLGSCIFFMMKTRANHINVFFILQYNLQVVKFYISCSLSHLMGTLITVVLI